MSFHKEFTPMPGTIRHSFLSLVLGASLTLFIPLMADKVDQTRQAEGLEKDNQRIDEVSQNIKKLYELDADEPWRDITEEVLASPYTSEDSQQSIIKFNRRIIVFKYPSDGLSIKGFFSYTPQPDYHPLLILYRWGNRDFALMNPGIDFATYRNYTVISSTLRGGVSEGVDEFGGADVNDMKNLMEYLPQLTQELGIEVHPPCVFMLGPSRGGMEMFLTLARFPELQDHVSKIVSLSGILDLHRLIQDRPEDMKKAFESDFGLEQGKKGEAWIAKRDPLNAVPYIKKSLPILIIQGTADQRVNLAEGHRMVEKLQVNGNRVDYWEILHGDHALMNTPHIMNAIAQWLESNSACASIKIKK